MICLECIISVCECQCGYHPSSLVVNVYDSYISRGPCHSILRVDNVGKGFIFTFYVSLEAFLNIKAGNFVLQILKGIM